MKFSTVITATVLLLSACGSAGGRESGRVDLDPEAQVQAIHQAMGQAADRAINTLGRPDGYYGNPKVRIPLPESLSRLERGMRRLGLERYIDEVSLSMNRAAEAAVPVAKPVLLAAVREISPGDAMGIIRGDADAATRYFREHTEAQLAVRLKPIVAEATARAGVTASYKRLLKKAAFLDKSADAAHLDLDAYVTREALAGLYLMMAEEERRIRHDPLARTTDLLKKAFR
jgi:hypothetical protein